MGASHDWQSTPRSWQEAIRTTQYTYYKVRRLNIFSALWCMVFPIFYVIIGMQTIPNGAFTYLDRINIIQMCYVHTQTHSTLQSLLCLCTNLYCLYEKYRLLLTGHLLKHVTSRRSGLTPSSFQLEFPVICDISLGSFAPWIYKRMANSPVIFAELSSTAWCH